MLHTGVGRTIDQQSELWVQVLTLLLTLWLWTLPLKDFRKVSPMQDEWVLGICCTTPCLELTIQYYVTSKFAKQVDLMLSVLTTKDKKQRITGRFWDVMDMSITLWLWYQGWMHMSKLIKLCTLNMSSSLYVNYNWIKLFFLRRDFFKDVMDALYFSYSDIHSLPHFFTYLISINSLIYAKN